MSTRLRPDSHVDLYMALSRAGFDLCVAANHIHGREGMSAAYLDTMRALDRVQEALQTERERRQANRATT